MGKIITIDYEGKQLRVDLDTMKATEVFDPKHFFPDTCEIQPSRELPKEMVWMDKNLDVDDGEGGITRNPDHPEYGCYYTWEAAMRIAGKIPGWHLPTVQEWDMLAVIAGGYNIAGKNMKAREGWNQDFAGEDLFDFTVLPAGRCYSGIFYDVGSYARFWTATEYNSDSAYHQFFGIDASMNSSNGYKTRQYSVRLVKDY